MIYFSNYKIGLEDIGRNNEATNKALLAIMQDIACLHSASVGYGVLEIETKKESMDAFGLENGGHKKA